jgi:lipopolysaccharide export system permease protein
MTRILDRYLLREVLAASFAVTLVLMLILMCYRFARVLGEAAAGELPRDAVLTLLGLTSVYYLLILAPFGLFLGVMLALGRLYRDSEMTAISACGIGPVRLLRPLLMLAALVAALLAWLALDIAPWAAGQALLTKRLAQRDAEIGILEAGRFKSADDGNIVFYAERVTEDGALENVFIQRRVGDVVQVALAARGEQRRDASTGERTMVLYDGQRLEGIPGTTDFRLLSFAEHGIPIRTSELPSVEDDPSTRATAELLGSPDVPALAELQWRLSTPIAAILLTILAVPLAKANPRQGRYSKLLVAVLAYVFYVNLLGAARVWLEQGRTPPVFGLWWVHVLVLALALLLLLVQNNMLGLRAVRVPATP